VSQLEEGTADKTKARFPLNAIACVGSQPVKAVATMIGCLPTQALAFLAVFVYATHAAQAIAFKWKPGLKPGFHSNATHATKNARNASA